MIDTFLVIEPHSDDAFLSLGAHIEAWVKEGRKVLIATVAPQEPKRLREAAQHAEAVGAKTILLGPGLDELVLCRNVQCILPVGIQHPEHIAVAEEYSEKCRNVWRYLDQPYGLKLKNAEEVNSKIGGARIISYLKPGARKWRHIPIFKTQAKFFHFNEEACYKSFELILEFEK